jgi:hypothetical protein
MDEEIETNTLCSIPVQSTNSRTLAFRVRVSAEGSREAELLRAAG